MADHEFVILSVHTTSYMVRYDHMRAVFALRAENRTPTEIKYRSAEGQKQPTA